MHLCLAGLDSPGRPAAQKALAEALVALGLRSDELPGGLARLQQLMATCHGSVTARLLPLALALVATEDDLVELTTTVAARPEKKQRTDLLRAITTGPLADVVPADGRRAALEILAESPDAALAGKASRALESLGGSAFPVAAVRTGRPRPVGARPAARHLPAADALPGGHRLRRAAPSTRSAPPPWSRSWQQPPPWQQPQALALVVRWAFRDGPRAVRRALGDLELPPYDANAFGPALAQLAGQAAPGGVRADRPARERLRAVRLEPGRAPPP